MYFGKAKIHLLKNTEIPHPATSREILPSWQTPLTPSKLQGSRTGGEKNFWPDWSSISTCISNQRKSFSFPKADSYTAVGTASQAFISLDWLSRTLPLRFPMCPQNSFLFKKHVRTSLQIAMHGVWSKGKCSVAVVSINVDPQYCKCLSFLPERKNYQ